MRICGALSKWTALLALLVFLPRLLLAQPPSPPDPPEVTSPENIHVPAGFKVELLYRVPKQEQGSWVSITVDAKGRLLCADQEGDIYRVTPAPADDPDPEAATRVEPLKSPIGRAHGLLYAFNHLYVMVGEGPEKGIYRLSDTHNTDAFDHAECIVPLLGLGEHGPHSLQLSPDGKSIFFCSGNHHSLPAEETKLGRAKSWIKTNIQTLLSGHLSRSIAKFKHVRGARAWAEDQLLPRMWDANGHAWGMLAPGGYIARIDPDGKNLELFSYGYRNEFDFAFNLNGDLFTYDGDMEWDIGTPWYRPTRINQAISGSDFGWRSGAGKWPTYYPDSLPATLDIGPGSPVGVSAGTGAKFPERYQKAIFGNDWTYGTMYAIHLTPEGAGYRAKKEEFLTGKPLPLTDLLIRPQDGAMYFLVGGRRNQSALYRLTYAGDEPTAPALPDILPAEATLRRELEALHVDGTGSEAIQRAWPHLSSRDRFLRYAARVAIEKQPPKHWAHLALGEKNPQAAIEALVALARVGDASLQPKLIQALCRLDYQKTPPELRLPLLRAWQLTFARMGKPSAQTCANLTTQLDPLFPQKDPFENRELLQLLVFLNSPTVVSKAVDLIHTLKPERPSEANDALLARNQEYAAVFQASSASQPVPQAIAFAYVLRNAIAGWTPELRRTFFSWFPQTGQWKGGNSFAKYLQNIRSEALANVQNDEERILLTNISTPSLSPDNPMLQSKGPGKNYSINDIVELAKNGLKGRNFARGKAMFSTSQCAACHHFAREGGDVGPDLTGAANRYSIRDLAESIVEPSKVINPQYAFAELTRRDGSTLLGRILSETNGEYELMPNLFTPKHTLRIPLNQVVSRKESSISPMPPGLINNLDPEDLLDLIAYLFSGGNPKDGAFSSTEATH